MISFDLKVVFVIYFLTDFFVDGRVRFFPREAFPEESPRSGEVERTGCQLRRNVRIRVWFHGVLQTKNSRLVLKYQNFYIECLA